MMTSRQIGSLWKRRKPIEINRKLNFETGKQVS